MPETAFLVIEAPGLDQVFSRYTARHPGCVMDVVLDPLRPGTPDVIVQACLLLRNAPPGTLDGLLEEARERYASLRTLERDDGAGRWLGMFRVPASGLTDPRALSLMGFLQAHGIGMRWVRIEEGTCYLRGQVPDPAAAAALAERCRGYVEGLGLDADVSLEAAPGGDLGLWRELALLAARHASR